MSDIERIRTRLCEMVEEKAVDIWLETPNAKFNNKKPIDLIKDGDKAFRGNDLQAGERDSLLKEEMTCGIKK